MNHDVLTRGVSALAEVVTEQHKAVTERDTLKQWIRELGVAAFGHNQSTFASLYSKLYERLKTAEALESKVRELESVISSGREANDNLHDKLNQADMDFSILMEQLRNANEQLNKTNDLIQIFTDERDAAKADLAKLHEVVESHFVPLTIHEVLQKQIEELKQKLEESEKALAESETAHWAGMEAKFDQHQRECQEKIALVEEQYKRNLDTLNEEKRALKAENEKLHAQIDKLLEESSKSKASGASGGGPGGVYPRPSAPTPAGTEAAAPPLRLQPDGSPAAEEAGPEAPAEGEPLLLNMSEFSKAMRKWIIQHGGNRSRALKAMGITIPTSMDSALFFKTTGTKRSKYAALFAQYLGPQILYKNPVRKPGQGPAA